ncbi:hypothetical protein FHW23_000150 [Curtobacterium pusillum]|uniref:Peptidase C51 domain-containing protein n=1 Tax=Curtobacterium pusillum TaxID=69373 RepID=A0AAW3T0M9_9MICO|nr:CHAP domain-containing protein [Curtobacterium pusillum]MBA8988918.1 hypothetical protein [Curtobacterium pusillum]
MKHLQNQGNSARGNRGLRAVASASVFGVVAAGLIVAGPVSSASADTKTTEDSIGWYRPSDSSWHLSFDTPPGDESDVAFVNGPTNSGSVVPVAGDWNGDGADSIAWYRYSDASWHMSDDLSGGPSDAAFIWGPAGDTSITPIVGDWDGDGKDTVGWYRPSDGSYHLANANTTSASSSAFQWGPAGNTSVKPVVGDWDGDGKDTVGWYRPSDGSYHLANANNTTAGSSAFVAGPAGNTTVTAIAGDWNGDGKDTVGWYRPSDGSYHLAAANTTNPSSSAFAWGPTGNTSVVPIVGDWDGKVTAPPPSSGLPSSPTAQQVIDYARSYMGKTVYQVDGSTAAPWHGYRGDWCAWFSTWALRNTTGGTYYTWVHDMRKLGTQLPAGASPRVGDIVIFGSDQHVGIVSKQVNGVWYVLDGNGLSTGTSGDWTTTKVAERPIWNQAHDFIRVDY